VAPEVREAMLPFLGENYGNPSSLHTAGRRARKALDESREIVAGSVKSQAREIFFTSGGTESVNLALRGVVTASFLKHGRRPMEVITTAVEHSAVLRCLESLEMEGLARVVRVGVDGDGRIDVASVSSQLRETTALVSVMAVNNETGNIHPIEAIGRLCRERGIPFHSDGVQALGKISIDLSALPVDLMSFSAHKIYGPKGVGALYVRSGVALHPLIPGVQEMEKRGGTENLPCIVGFGAAMNLMKRDFERESDRQRGLRNLLEIGLKSRIDGVRVHGDPKHRVGNTLNASFEGVSTETAVMALDREGIFVSSGSACASGAIEPSHVLMAMGLSKADAKGAVRFSLGRGSSEHDIEYVLDVVPGVIKGLRGGAGCLTFV